MFVYTLMKTSNIKWERAMIKLEYDLPLIPPHKIATVWDLPILKSENNNYTIEGILKGRNGREAKAAVSI